MKIILCEDNKTFRERLELVINNYIKMENINMQIVLSAANPNEVLDYIEKNGSAECYFLDIDLGEKYINGIELGVKIRKNNPAANLIYITARDDMYITVLDNMLSPLGYVVKDKIESITETVKKYLDFIYNQNAKEINNNEKMAINVGIQKILVAYSDILFFETIGDGHKLRVYTKNRIIEFYDKLSNIENVNTNFVRSHRSYVVNINNIETLTRDSVIFSNGASCFVSRTKYKKLKELLLKREG